MSKFSWFFLFIFTMALANIRINPESRNLVTIFAHGLGGSAKQGDYYHATASVKSAFIEGKLITFNFKDVNDPKTSCLGQEDDINELKSRAQAHQSKILIGVSRGAATIINYLGTSSDTGVKAAILESPFDTVASVVAHQYGTSWLHPLSAFVFTHYKPFGIQPFKVISSLSLDIPVLFVCSKEDSLIPIKSTVKLYRLLYKSGHTKVHILILDKGSHASILWGPEGNIYQEVVHAFYKHYNLPHNTQWAQAGKKRFSQCQPSSE